jgi:holo-[acyl-carrier protein] synthase
MIESVGIDIVEVYRIKTAIERWGDRFIQRVFTPWEINYCQNKSFPELSFAARFAVKEAVLKAIGTGLSKGAKWTSIEIVNDDLGQPQVRLGTTIKEIIGAKRIIVSMSHTHEHAVASAIMYVNGKAQ